MVSTRQKILIAGSRGMVGSAIVRRMRSDGYQNLLTPAREELDLTDQKSVHSYLKEHRPDLVIIAAAKVGGIYANMTYPAEFIYTNLMIVSNLVHGSHLAGIDKLLYLGSTCIYPKLAPQPIPEDALLTGALEPSNEAYAVAKIAGLKLCEFYSKQYDRNYSALMPTNLFGPNDNYHPENAHVIPALLRRIHEAKVAQKEEVVVWGSGKPLREFLYVDDLADAILFLIQKAYRGAYLNVGSNEEVSIKELAEKIAKAVGYTGKILFDLSKPDGTPRKKTELKRILQLGWKPKMPLEDGLRHCYDDFLRHLGNLRS